MNDLGKVLDFDGTVAVELVEIGGLREIRGQEKNRRGGEFGIRNRAAGIRGAGQRIPACMNVRKYLGQVFIAIFIAMLIAVFVMGGGLELSLSEGCNGRK